MKLLSHLAGYLPVNIASGIASFGGVYVFTRLLGAHDYGVYALMLSVLALIHTISLTWVEAANYRFTGRAVESGELPDHYRTALSLMLRSIAGALVLAGLVWWAVRDMPRYAEIAPWIAVLLPINTVVQMALESHKAGQRVGRYAAVETFRLLAGFALGAIFCWALKWGAAAPFIGLAVAGGVLALFEGPWLLKAAKGGAVKPATRTAWVRYGVPIAAALVLDILLSASDRFLIAWIIDEAAVGAYAAGYGVADKTVLLICAWAAMAGSPLVMAAYESGGPNGARDEAAGLARTLLLIGMPAAVGLALVAEPLAGAMIGEAVRDEAQTIIPWIAFAGLMNGFLIYYFSESFQLAHKTGQRALLMMVPAGANIILNLIMLPRFGIMGAVWATLISYAIGIVLLGWVGRKHVALPVPLVDFVKVSLACLAMWPVIYVMPELSPWASLFLNAAAGGLAYVCAAFALDAGGARAFVRNRRQSAEKSA